MIRRPPRSTLFPTRRSSDLALVAQDLPPEEYEIVVSDDAASEETRRQVEKKWADRAQPAVRYVLPHPARGPARSEEHTSELQSHVNLVCRLLLEKKKQKKVTVYVITFSVVLAIVSPIALHY